jgi:hypothetical protein
MCALRAYLRHRADLLQPRASPILPMQKALQPMNRQLPQVLSDITGETGLAIVRAIVAGERDGVKLAPLRDYRCKSSEETLAKALGNRRLHGHVEGRAPVCAQASPGVLRFLPAANRRLGRADPAARCDAEAPMDRRPNAFDGRAEEAKKQTHACPRLRWAGRHRPLDRRGFGRRHGHWAGTGPHHPGRNRYGHGQVAQRQAFCRRVRGGPAPRYFRRTRTPLPNPPHPQPGGPGLSPSGDLGQPEFDRRWRLLPAQARPRRPLIGPGGHRP